jgi:hypothetical protein
MIDSAATVDGVQRRCPRPGIRSITAATVPDPERGEELRARQQEEHVARMEVVSLPLQDLHEGWEASPAPPRSR